jgi:hypothetical protein
VRSRKVRNNDAAQREEHVPGSARVARTLRDLPTYGEAQDELATDPVIRLTQRVPALPPLLPPLPSDGGPSDHSLEALALLARRSAPPPLAPVPTVLIAPVAARGPVAASTQTLVPPVLAQARPTSSVPPVAVSASNAPPPSSNPPWPRRRAGDNGSRRGGPGTVVLSATVGAIVALGIWTLRSGIDHVARKDAPVPALTTIAAGTAAAADKCATPASPAAASTVASSTISGVSTAEAAPPHVTFDALPIAQSGSSTSSRATARRTTTTPRAAFVSTQESSEGETRPVARRSSSAPKDPRAAVASAVQRASSAARSCETGPQNGKVEVTFSPTGAVSSVNLIKGFDDAGVNGCVLRAFGRVRINAFEGDPITVRKSVSW